MYAIFLFLIHLVVRISQALTEAVQAIECWFSGSAGDHDDGADRELLKGDLTALPKLPQHIGIVLPSSHFEENRLEHNIERAASWCLASGVRCLSIFAPGKSFDSEHVAFVSEKLAASPLVHEAAPVRNPVVSVKRVSDEAKRDEASRFDLAVILVSAEDGCERIAKVANSIRAKAQATGKVDGSMMSADALDKMLLFDPLLPEPQIVLRLTEDRHLELQGYPPWQLKHAEILHYRCRNETIISIDAFRAALYRFGRIQQRFGR
ncbi:hypothetical protein GQ42DRAFT_166028 [Ramicandelaber brevisporus]|nr:hypothetical protein GQ42DRAFT_166028 [Ramicandelaber brevisporus]